ncbi:MULTISPECIES: Ada metal-binding domain-containing protein [unclassified Paenibacillus]|uniref:Ada metal-binding domain-containing protein n=1 Tax=unclassified Paenibacillus TaxID=185978 RepID=UPI0009A5D27E
MTHKSSLLADSTYLDRYNSPLHGKFFYAIKTIRIFCRPSFKSRVPNRDNVDIFMSYK